MSIVFWGISPHPPLLIPEIGNLMLKEVENTKAALKNLSKKLINSAPQVLILITPHGPVSMDKISILGKEEIQGDFFNFGCPQVSLKFKIEQNLKKLILEESKEASIPIKLETGRSVNLDHAQLVPLFYFKEAGLNIPLVSISIGMLSYLELYNFGKAIQKAAEKSNLKVALVSSGDLSHRLKPGAPAGYDPKGKIFDELLIKYLKEMDIKSILEIDPELIERAGECGLRPIIILLGSIFNKKVKSKVLSYEGPFGVGYAVVSIEELKTQNKNLVNLARLAVEEYIKNGRIISPPEMLEGILKEKAGVFVCIKKMGDLRGCIGTLSPMKKNIAEEIIHNAISSASRDPRFFKVNEDELKELTFSIDVLKEAEKIKNLSELDPKKYGIIVKSSFKSGVLLPNLEGIDNIEKQIEIALSKAGISHKENYEIYRFEVERYE